MTVEQLMGTILKKAYYSEPEVCQLAGLPYDTMRKRERRHELPNRGVRTRIVDHGKTQLFYPVDQVAEWLVQLGQQFTRKGRHPVAAATERTDQDFSSGMDE